MSGLTFPTALLAAISCLPQALGDTCSAIGVRTTNSAGFAIGGTTYSDSNGIILYNGAGDQIGSYDQCDNCDSICADFIAVPTDQLASTFEWGATCSGEDISECHGAYGSQTHIDGDSPENGDDFYGLGISTTSECKAEFEC